MAPVPASSHPESGGSQPTLVTVNLDSADILALDDGIEFGPTPEAGKMVVPVYAVCAYSFGTTSYTPGGDFLVTTLAAFANDPGNDAWGVFNVLGESASAVALMNPIDNIDQGAALVDGKRLALAIVSIADGDGTAQVNVWYVIVDAPTDAA